MFDHDDFFSAGQFVISYELIALLNWFIAHEDKVLTKLVRRAVQDGIKYSVHNEPHLSHTELSQKAQQTIIDFFTILESHMIDALDKDTVQHAIAKNLLPAIDQIDTTACDPLAMRKSIEKATHAHEAQTQEQAKELLCKELLRHWKPTKNQALN